MAADLAVLEAKELALDMTAQVCGRCGDSDSSVSLRPCRTAYAKPENNVDPLLCDRCAEDYAAYWDAMWYDYIESRG